MSNHLSVWDVFIQIILASVCKVPASHFFFQCRTDTVRIPVALSLFVQFIQSVFAITAYVVYIPKSKERKSEEGRKKRDMFIFLMEDMLC